MPWPWLTKYWKELVILALAAALALSIIFRPRPPVSSAEIDVARAEAEVEKLEVRQEHKAAVEKVEAQYARKKAELTTKQEAQAEELASDPEAIARLVSRASRRARATRLGTR